MSTEHGAAMPGPEDFDRQLRELTSGAGTARFREPSAAERAGIAGRAARAGRRSGRRRYSVMNRRQARQASNLRKPVTSGPGGAGRGSTFLRRARHPLHKYPVRKRRGPQRMPGRSRRQRLLGLAKAAGILAGFIALLALMHMLGLGPR